jgi:hypothetical protein
MWSLVTCKVHTTRSIIIWLNQMLFTNKVDGVGILPASIETDIDIPLPEDRKNSDDTGTDTYMNEDPDSEGD